MSQDIRPLVFLLICYLMNIEEHLQIEFLLMVFNFDPAG